MIDVEPTKTKYFFKRIVFENEEGISELISVTKENWKGYIVTPETLCCSLKDTPIHKASKELKDSIGVDFKEYVSEEQAYAIVERFEKEGEFSYRNEAPLE